MKVMESRRSEGSIANSEPKDGVMNVDESFKEMSLTRCKTADLIGNMRRKGIKYFQGMNSDDEDEDDEDKVRASGNGDSSNESEYDEVVLCNVCDRSFSTARQLMQHQSLKRHFQCSVCHELFPSIHSLKEHKDSLSHWSMDDYEEDSDQETSKNKDNDGQSHRDGNQASKLQPMLPCDEFERLL